MNAVVYPSAELRARVSEGQTFLTSVLGGAKLWLVGDDEALAALLAGRQPDRA